MLIFSYLVGIGGGAINCFCSIFSYNKLKKKKSFLNIGFFFPSLPKFLSMICFCCIFRSLPEMTPIRVQHSVHLSFLVSHLYWIIVLLFLSVYLCKTDLYCVSKQVKNHHHVGKQTCQFLSLIYFPQRRRLLQELGEKKIPFLGPSDRGFQQLVSWSYFFNYDKIVINNYTDRDIDYVRPLFHCIFSGIPATLAWC